MAMDFWFLSLLLLGYMSLFVTLLDMSYRNF